MRILHAMAGSGAGGAEAFFVRLVRALKDAGETECAVVRPNAARSEALRHAGIDPIETRFGQLFDFRTKGVLARAFDDFKPDVVMSWMNRAARACGRARGGRQFVHVGRLGGYYDLKYYRDCDHLIGNTPDIVDYLVGEGWPEAKAHFVPNFVDAQPAPAADRSMHDTPADAPLLLLLGRLHRNKAIDVAIHSLARSPEAFLWVAGDGPLRQELEALARSTGLSDRVRFLGWRGDVAALLAAADILICPSRHEPLGNVIIEGWAHKTPVVAADSAGPSWLIEDEKTGLLTPMEDPVALSVAVTRLLDDGSLRQTVIDGGHAAFEAQFTERAVVANYRELFARLTR